jgi:RES domain-containing protein
VIVWRIAAETRDHRADDRTGAGARATGGRWNRQGSPVIYASANVALACLETIVHFRTTDLPLNRILVKVEIPDRAWAARAEIDAAAAPVGWDVQPAGLASIEYGERWLSGGASLVLGVPSAIIPEEQNYLINPSHPAMAAVRMVRVRRFTYDPRLG